MFAVGQLFTVMNGQHTTASNTYHLLDSIGVVNHSLHFVDPATSAHTQHAESYWNRVKTKFKRMKSVHESMLPSYLDEFVAGTSWKYCFHSSGKSVSGHCSQVPRLGSRVAPSAGPHLRQYVRVFVFSTGFF